MKENAIDRLRAWNRNPRDGNDAYLDEESQAWNDLCIALAAFTSSDEDTANAYSCGRADAELELEEAEIARLKEINTTLTSACEAIAAQEGMCIFGSPERSDDPAQAYRQGSADAFYACAKVVRDTLAKVRGEVHA